MSKLLSGWIVLDKPLGISSAQALNKIKHLLKKERILSKIGHAGTLDPLATGVLPIALGEATKTVSYIQNAEKEYAFTVTWGEERSTDDLEGEVIFSSSNLPIKQEILSLLPQFTGNISQVPPRFSALKIAGERSYMRARKGEEFNPASRDVTIYDLQLSQIEKNKAFFWVRCGKGTYVRALARDLGRALGCFGYVSSLRRLRVGNFTCSQSILLDNLADLVHKKKEFLIPLDKVLVDIPALVLDDKKAKALSCGQRILVDSLDTIDFSFVKKDQVFLVKSSSGVLIGIGCLDKEGPFLVLKRGFRN